MQITAYHDFPYDNMYIHVYRIDRGNSIFVKRLETFEFSAIYKLNIIII